VSDVTAVTKEVQFLDFALRLAIGGVLPLDWTPDAGLPSDRRLCIN